MVTTGAAHTGEALLKIPTFQVLSDYMGNDRTEEAILPREEIVIAILKFVKVIIE